MRINPVDCVTILFLIVVIFSFEKNTCFLDLLLSLFIYKSNFHVFLEENLKNDPQCFRAGSNSNRPLHFPNSNARVLVVPKFSLP